LRKLILLMIVALAVSSLQAQVRGKGRLQGTVIDKSGKPIPGAKVTVAPEGGRTTPVVTKSDGKGKWAVLGLTNGTWNVDITASGYVAAAGTVAVSEFQMAPPIKTMLEAEVKEEAPAATTEVTSSVPKEAVDAIRAGEELFKQEKYKEAVVELEKALPLIPGDSGDLQNVQRQVRQLLSQSYYRAGDIDKAIEMLEAVTTAAADPFVTSDAPLAALRVLLVNLYLEAGQLEKGKALLENLPATAITDPTMFVNVGILFLNKANPAEAERYFSKAIALDSKSAASHYYRGLAWIQLKKMKEAKADLQQVLALAPDSAEARDAKQLLAGIK